MTFVARYQEAFESVVLDNILAIVKRDFKSALDLFYPLTAAGTPHLDDSAARPIGTTTLHMDGFTVKPADGDHFTIAGDTQVYKVESATALVGTDSDVTFAPGLKIAIPAVDGNEVVTFTGLPDLTRTLGDFANFRGSMPSLAIEPGDGGGEQADHFESLALKVNLYMAVEDEDPTDCLRKLMKYVRTLRAVLKSAPLSDLTTGISPNYVFGIVPELSWQYFIMGKDADRGTWARNVKVELSLKYDER